MVYVKFLLIQRSRLERAKDPNQNEMACQRQFGAHYGGIRNLDRQEALTTIPKTNKIKGMGAKSITQLAR
jgi:hypothetical protein